MRTHSSILIEKTRCCGMYYLHGMWPEKNVPTGRKIREWGGHLFPESRTETMEEHAQEMVRKLRDFMAPQAGGRNKKPFVVFTDPVKNGYGTFFKKFIAKHKLGSVTVSKTRMNPNSMNLLQAFMWSVDYDRVLRFK